MSKSVEAWLNEVDYSIDPHYVPSDFALEFINFIKLVNGGKGEENKTPILHYKMLDQLAYGGDRLANMIHRGAAKTAVMGEYLFLYLGFTGGVLPHFGRIELALYISDSIENGVKNMRKNLEFRRENSPFLMKYIPKIRFTDIEWQFENLDGNKFIVKGFGAKTGVRGTKSMGKRPKLAVLDDLISDEDARSDVVIKSIKETVYKAVDFALHPTHNKIIWSGTPYNARDPLYEAIESGAWDVNVYPVCEKFPCSKEEFRGSWEDRFPYEYVLKKYKQAKKSGEIKAFNQELMLRIMSEEDRLIDTSDLKWYKKESLLNSKSNFNFYITTDFATTEKESADFSVISVWAYNNNGDWFWVDGIAKKQTMDKNIDDLFRLVSEYIPISVGIEVTGQQSGFISWIQQEMMNKNIWFNLASKDNSEQAGIRPNTNKMQRFNVVVPLFKAGKMYFPVNHDFHPALQEMLEELSLASVSGFKSKHDDAIDTISMLPLMKAYKPSATDINFLADENNVYKTNEVVSNYDNSYFV